MYKLKVQAKYEIHNFVFPDLQLVTYTKTKQEINTIGREGKVAH